MWYDIAKEVTNMTTLTASKARARLYKLLDEAAACHEPIQITGRRSNGILISETDWTAIQETLYPAVHPEDEGVDPQGAEDTGPEVL
jgi:PHD/YefM family antitoxin component YafN of YafNO toxin-antitoxin module